MEGSGIVPVIMCFTVTPGILPPLPVRRIIIILSLTEYAWGSSPALGTMQGTGGFVVLPVGLFTNMILIKNKLR